MDPPGTLGTIAFALGAWCLLSAALGPVIGCWLRRVRKRQTVRVKRGDRS